MDRLNSFRKWLLTDVGILILLALASVLFSKCCFCSRILRYPSNPKTPAIRVTNRIASLVLILWVRRTHRFEIAALALDRCMGHLS